jgi:hypothetical protein
MSRSTLALLALLTACTSADPVAERAPDGVGRSPDGEASARREEPVKGLLAPAELEALRLRLLQRASPDRSGGTRILGGQEGEPSDPASPGNEVDDGDGATPAEPPPPAPAETADTGL